MFRPEKMKHDFQGGNCSWQTVTIVYEEYVYSEQLVACGNWAYIGGVGTGLPATDKCGNYIMIVNIVSNQCDKSTHLI